MFVGLSFTASFSRRQLSSIALWVVGRVNVNIKTTDCTMTTSSITPEVRFLSRRVLIFLRVYI
jgi:hypothetical protein